MIEPTLIGKNVLLKLLTRNDLILWLKDKISAENLFGYKIDTGPVERMLLSAFNTKIDNMRKDPGKEIWYSYYAIIYDKKIVGHIGPKGLPDKMNQIEIGYGLSQTYWNRGIATESIKLLCRWYFISTDISKIIAETDSSNIGSQKVLIKNNFIKANDGKSKEGKEDKKLWELSRQSFYAASPNSA